MSTVKELGGVEIVNGVNAFLNMGGHIVAIHYEQTDILTISKEYTRIGQVEWLIGKFDTATLKYVNNFNDIKVRS